MASLRLGVRVGRVWLFELFDPRPYRGSYRLSGWGLDRVLGLGFALVQSGRGRRRRGRRLPVLLELWDELPSGSRVLV